MMSARSDIQSLALLALQYTQSVLVLGSPSEAGVPHPKKRAHDAQCCERMVGAARYSREGHEYSESSKAPYLRRLHSLQQATTEKKERHIPQKHVSPLRCIHDDLS